MVDTIAAVIAPYVGAGMARPAVQAQAQRLEIGAEGPSPEQLEALLARVGSGLAVFVGRAKSATVVEEARRALAQALVS